VSIASDDFVYAVQDAIEENLSHYRPVGSRSYHGDYVAEHVGSSVWKVTDPDGREYILRLQVRAEEL
jgi:hypothetical protein